MIGMQYTSNNLQARGGGGFASSIFASSAYPPEAKCKKDGTFTINEPISVLDTRSPSPSTSTSTFSSFNNTNRQVHKVVNEPTSTAARGGGKEEWVADLQPPVHNAGLELSHRVCENANLGLEDWENLSESTGKHDEILKLLLLQAGNQNEVQGIVGFGAIDKSSEFTGGSAIAPVGNVFSSSNMSAFGLSGSGFSLNDHKGKNCFDSNSLLIDNNGDALQCLVPYIAFQEEFQTLDQKVEIFNPQGVLNPVLERNAANPSGTNLNPLLYGTQQEQQNQLQPLLKHHNMGSVASNLGSLNIKVPFVDPGHQLLPIKQQHLSQMLQPPADLFQRPNLIPPHQLQEVAVLVPKCEATGGCCSEQMGVSIQQQQFVYDQVYKAAELIQAGNFSNAQGILARLNHFLAPIGKPFPRSAFYVKEALELACMMPNQVASVPPRIPAPFDGMFKMGAYKVFCEVSPVIQFMNFTANQVLLEALGDAEQIHIIDFDIGFGAHWSSFLQELPRKNRGVTSVKITAFASPSTHHPLGISLMHENLTQFANDLGINFELEVVNIDSFNPNCNSVSSFRSSEGEAIAVNFPIWSFTSYLSALPSYLFLIKRLAPKILVSLGCGCERIDLPFSHHILHTLQYYEALLDSVDAANVTSAASNKIEKFLFQPRIESTVLGRLAYPDIMPPWRKLFESVGYLPVSISNFAETQAECVLKRMQVGGFHVERQQASLLLCWQCCELLSVSAWNC
ncbi:hypothetical protein Pfo_010174 [Paulownia fortunei]|nr:hypothetical protein Pfo_010174 [Paulownia fortunei]